MHLCVPIIMAIDQKAAISEHSKRGNLEIISNATE